VRHRPHYYKLVVWLAAALLTAPFLSACSKTEKPAFLSTDITGADFGKDFNLTDHNGKMRTLADFKGQVVTVFFGYTHCPDACPATMANLAAAMDILGADAARVQVLFITVDPERDRPEVLKAYLSAFNPRFLGLYGDERAIKKAAKEFNVVYQKQQGGAHQHDSVDHSTGTYIYDTKGKLRLYVSNDKGANVFAHDISQLLKTSG
jgi:protein SCO1